MEGDRRMTRYDVYAKDASGGKSVRKTIIASDITKAIEIVQSEYKEKYGHRPDETKVAKAKEGGDN